MAVIVRARTTRPTRAAGPQTPKNSKLLSVKIGEQKFFVCDRGLVLGDELTDKKPPPGSQIDRAINALAGVERVSFPITSLDSIASSIRKRHGFFSRGSLVAALDRLGIPLRLDGMGQLLAGVSRDWIRRQRAIGNVYERQTIRASRARTKALRDGCVASEASDRLSDAYQFDRGLLVDPIHLGVDSRGFIRDRY